MPVQAQALIQAGAQAELGLCDCICFCKFINSMSMSVGHSHVTTEVTRMRPQPYSVPTCGHMFRQDCSGAQLPLPPNRTVQAGAVFACWITLIRKISKLFFVSSLESQAVSNWSHEASVKAFSVLHLAQALPAHDLC